MELAAAAKVLSCYVVLLCLLSVCLCSGRQEAASLCKSFNVVKSESGHWRNEVQGLLNRQTFFLYKDNKCHASGAHGNSLNATKICEKQVDTLKHGGDIFKGMLLQLWGEMNTIREKTIKTVDRIQHTSDNALVIIGSTLAAMLFMGLIISGSCYVSRRHLHERKMDVQSSSPSLLADSLTLPETSSANEADEFPTASQNSVLLTLDHTDGNP